MTYNKFQELRKREAARLNVPETSAVLNAALADEVKKHPRLALSEDDPLRSAPLFVKGNQTWSLKEGDYETGRCGIHVNNAEHERIWVAISPDGKEMAFLNNALNLLPAASWGAVFPFAESLDAGIIRGKTPQDLTLTLHPSAWKSKVELGIINEKGLFLGWLK